jgi:hypothetical protein
MCYGRKTWVPCKLYAHVEGEFCGERGEVRVIEEETVEGGCVDVEGEDVGAGFGEGGEVVVELLGMLVEGGGNEAAELLSQGDRAGAAKGDREDVGRHFLREEQKEKGRGGWLTAVLCLPIFLDLEGSTSTRNSSHKGHPRHTTKLHSETLRIDITDIHQPI